MSVLAIDAGTTGVTALVVDETGGIVARGYQEFPQHFPRPGWVEHEPEEIWLATLSACRGAIDAARAAEVPAVTAIGITNQRETVLLWDRRTLRAPRRAIVWQDPRSADICAEFEAAGHGARVSELTGLRLDPYFSATKLTWLARNEPDVWRGVTEGRLVAGTVDAYLVARLTGGEVLATEVSNASRTLLYDTFGGGWSAELGELFGVPEIALPAVVDSSGVLGHTDPGEFLGLRLPVAGIAGDQQAALFGQACFDVGATKCTYGTGSFVLTNTGDTPVRSEHGLLTTIAWDLGDGPVYALEGSIFVTGAAAEIEGLAATVPDTPGVVFVPALTGLGAPYWDPSARGTILGLTRGATRAHLARATLAAIAYEVRDVLGVMATELAGGDRPVAEVIPELSVDGGASANSLLCQLQADQLGLPVRRPRVTETTGLGAAFLAGLATGVWSSTEQLAQTWQLDARFTPSGDGDEDGYRLWRVAVDRTRNWPG